MADDPLAALGAFTYRIDLHLEPRDGVALKSPRQIILDLAVRGGPRASTTWPTIRLPHDA